MEPLYPDVHVPGAVIERACDAIQDKIEEKFLELQRAGLVIEQRDVEAWLFRLKMHLFTVLGYKPDEADEQRWVHGDLAKRPCPNKVC